MSAWKMIVSINIFVYFFLQAPDLITAFDEHRVSSNFKFGVLYQKEGQVGFNINLTNILNI